MTREEKKTTLIVDDDESICRTLSAILSSEGYETATSTTAAEAVEKHARSPNEAIQTLVKERLDRMREVGRLGQKRQELVSKLEKANLPMEKERPSIEVIATQDNAIARLVEMTERSMCRIDIVTSLLELKMAHANRTEELGRKILKTVKMRIVVQNIELDAFTKAILQTSEDGGNRIQLMMMERTPFNLLIVDDKEAMWGEPPTTTTGVRRLF